MMACYEILQNLHTGCNRRPKYLWPAGVVIELDPDNRRVVTWLNQKVIVRVADDTPLTDPATLAARLKALRLNASPSRKPLKRRSRR